MNLPEDIISLILDYLSFLDTKNIIYVNKSYNEKYRLVYRDKIIRHKFPYRILHALDYKNQYPILKYCLSFCGATGYIDRIKISDVTDPIMLGIDCHGRPFFTIRYKIEDDITLQTYFQRYKNYSLVWSMGTRYWKFSSSIGTNRVGNEELQKIREIVNHKLYKLF
jgi:hypothetical protein